MPDTTTPRLTRTDEDGAAYRWREHLIYDADPDAPRSPGWIIKVDGAIWDEVRTLREIRSALAELADEKWCADCGIDPCCCEPEPPAVAEGGAR